MTYIKVDVNNRTRLLLHGYYTEWDVTCKPHFGLILRIWLYFKYETIIKEHVSFFSFWTEWFAYP